MPALRIANHGITPAQVTEVLQYNQVWPGTKTLSLIQPISTAVCFPKETYLELFQQTMCCFLPLEDSR